MFLVKESEREYRNGNCGPKYLMKGPRMNFGVILLKPGQDAGAHYHQIMEENFFVLEGTLTIYVDGKKQELCTGTLIHLEPGEQHYLKNEGSGDCKLAFCLAPYQEEDKITVPNPV